jgi:hypothetical protein
VLLARRWRTAVTIAAAVVPALVTLTIWKSRGLGHVPLFSLGETHLAAGVDRMSAIASIDLGKYVNLDVGHWKTEMDELREFFWSSRIAQWIPIAGLLAVARRSLPLAGLLGGWLASFLVVKGFSPAASIQSGSFWRLLMPAWPAYLVLLASIPLIVPALGPRIGRRFGPPAFTAIGRRTVVVAAVVLAFVPLVVVAALPRLGPQDAKPAVIQQVDGNILLTAVDRGIHVTVRRRGARRVLSWRTPGYGSKVFYRIYRTSNPRGDTRCESSGGSARCFLISDVVATTRAKRYVDTTVTGRVAYRIGVGTNYLDDPSGGDVFVFSPEIGG